MHGHNRRSVTRSESVVANVLIIFFSDIRSRSAASVVMAINATKQLIENTQYRTPGDQYMMSSTLTNQRLYTCKCPVIVIISSDTLSGIHLIPLYVLSVVITTSYLARHPRPLQRLCPINQVCSLFASVQRRTRRSHWISVQ